MRTMQAGGLVLAFVLGSLVACNGVEESPKDMGADGPSVPEAGSTTVLIGPSGGTFSFHGGKVKLEVPPGALAKNTPIAALIPKSYPPAARLVPGTVYDLLPDGTTFNKGVKLSISYDQGDVPPSTAEMDLRIHKVVSGVWTLVPGGGVDTKANVVWTGLNGFSKYGISGPSTTAVDGMSDAGVDATVPVDASQPDAPDGPKPDATKLDMPQLDATMPDMPKPDAPKPDATMPDMPKPDAPKSDATISDMPKPDALVPPDAPLPLDMPKPDAGSTCGTNSNCGTIVYVSTASHNGNFGGRSGLDSFCKSKMPTGLSCTNVHALIGVSSSDEIQDMPSNYGYEAAKPLYWYNKTNKNLTKFASNWPDMFDGTIAVSRLVGTGEDSHVWTGSENNGGLHKSFRFCCLGWTTAWGSLAWNGGHTLKGNDNSGIAAIPGVTTNWLQTFSTTPTKHKYGPKTCCYFGTSKCPGSCPSATSTTHDRLLCANSARVMCACEPPVSCQGKLTNTCLISGGCYKAGALHPGKCAVCDPSTSATSWTVKGSMYCLISNLCKKSGDKDLSGCAACDPTNSKDSWTILPGFCKIDGSCYKSGANHSAGCATCDPSKSTTTWTPTGNNCVINGNCYKSGANHSAGCGACAPSKSKTDWTVSGNQCLIGTVCRANGAKEPGGCGVCDPSKSKTSWSRPGGCLATHAWSRSFGDASVHGVAVDSNGNIYITGHFNSSINFGGFTLYKGVQGNGALFLASFTSSGKHRWSKAFSSQGINIGYDVVVDGNGNVNITGTLYTTINFGGSTLISKGQVDVFVASFTPGGKHRWSKSFGGADYDKVYAMAVDAAGNTYITGAFTSGSINFGGTTLTSKGAYLASFSSTGNHRWSKSFGGAGGRAVAVDVNGNTYITGLFGNSIGGGSVNFGGTTLTSKVGFDIFLASFASTGAHRWSKSFGSDSTNDVGDAVAVDGNANVFITGNFGKLIDFGGGKLMSNGTTDIFVASYTSGGNHRWSKAFGSSTSYDKSYAINVDTKGNVYVTGYFYPSINFGGGTLTSGGSMDLFVVSLTPAGMHRWSRSHGSTNYDQGMAIKTDGSGATYVAGGFGYTVDFGGGPFTATGASDIVLLKLTP